MPVLLKESAARDLRRLLPRYLDEARAAGLRLKTKDEEALHEFRVAVRRLHTYLQAYRKILGKAASRKIRAELKNLIVSTNAARDAETQERLLAPDGSPSSAALRGLKTLLHEEVERGRAAAADSTLPVFAAAAETIAKRLRAVSPRGRARMETALLKRLSRCSRKMRLHSSRARSLKDQSEIHKTRIWGKRMRYLIEPFSRELASSRKALRGLRGLQDVLGGLHDAQRLENRLKRLRTGDPRVADLLRDLRAREKKLFSRFRRMSLPIMKRT